MDNPIPSTVNKSSTCKELITWIFSATPNIPKSCIIQEMESQNVHKYNA